jgi:hypothetical protein
MDTEMKIQVVHPTSQEYYERALKAVAALRTEEIGCTDNPANEHWFELEFALRILNPKALTAAKQAAEKRIEALKRAMCGHCYIAWEDAETARGALAAQALAQPAERSEWISVKDRLPEESLGSVLCAYDAEAWKSFDYGHYEEFYTGPVDKANTIFARAHAGRYITHWMPLPKPPQAPASKE